MPASFLSCAHQCPRHSRVPLPPHAVGHAPTALLVTTAHPCLPPCHTPHTNAPGTTAHPRLHLVVPGALPRTPAHSCHASYTSTLTPQARLLTLAIPVASALATPRTPPPKAQQHTTVHVCWSGMGIVVQTNATDHNIFNHATKCNDPVFKLGDVLEVFIGPVERATDNPEYYHEIDTASSGALWASQVRVCFGVARVH